MSDESAPTPQNPTVPQAGFSAPDAKPVITRDQINAQWSRVITERTASVMLELPSGQIIEAQRPNLFYLFQEDRVPDSLSPIVGRWMGIVKGGGNAEDIIEDVEREVTEDPLSGANKMLELIQYVVCQVAVTPKFSLLEEEGCVPISYMDMDDQLYVFTWAQGVDDNLATFRRQSEEFVAAASNGEDIFGASKRMFGTRSDKTRPGMAGVANQ